MPLVRRLVPLGAGMALLLGGVAGAVVAQPAAPPAALPLPTPALQPLPPPPGAGPAQPITLAQAIDLALANQPTLAQAAAGQRAASARITQAMSNLLPSLSASAGASRSGASATGGGGVGSLTQSNFSASLSAQQLLFDFGRSRNQVSQARTQARAAGAALTQTESDVVNQVKQAYYQLLQDEQLVVVQQQNVADQQAHLAMAQALVSAGTAPPADVVRAEAAVANAQVSLAGSLNTAAKARVNLNVAMGIDPRTPTQTVETVEPAVPGQPAELVATALRQRADVRQAELGVASARLGVRIAKAGNLPSVVAQADYGLRDNSFPPSNSNWEYGVALQFPFYDGGLTRGRTREAEANVASAQASLRQVQQTVSSEVAQAYLNVQTAEQQVALSQAAVADAQESLNVAVGRYEEGVGIYLDVIDAQATLLQARTDQVNARYGLSAARAALRRALGLPEG